MPKDPFMEHFPVIPSLHWYQRWWVIIIGIIVGLCIMIGSGFGMAVWKFKTNYEQGKYYDPRSGRFLTELPIAPSLMEGRKQNVPIGNNPSIGPVDAPVVIIAFEDFACPFSLQSEPILKSILNQYNNQVLFVYRDFGINEQEGTVSQAAVASQCAHEQGAYWEYHDILFANQNKQDTESLKEHAKTIGLNADEFNSCLDSMKYKTEVENDIRDGAALGVIGTPTWFINGVRYSGVLREKDFKMIIDAELKYSK